MQIDKNYIKNLSKNLYFAIDDEQCCKMLPIINAINDIDFFESPYQNKINNKNIIIRNDIPNHTNLDVLNNTTIVNKYVVSK
jgi:hypothetical protein